MATNFIHLFVLFSIVPLIACITPPWRTCDSKNTMANVTNVDVNASIADGTVQLKKGTSVEVTVQFKMLEGSANTITAVVHGILEHIPIPFPLDNPNACKGCGLTCPLEAPKSYTYTSVIAVKSEYPDVRVIVEWELTDQNKKDIWCIELPAEIS